MNRRMNRRHRQPSNVFSMLTTTQISSLKEFFNMMDNPSDGQIDYADLQNFLPSIVNADQLYELNSLLMPIDKIEFYAMIAALSDKFIGINGKDHIKRLLMNISDDGRTVDKGELCRYLQCSFLSKEDISYVFAPFNDKKSVEINKVVNLIRHGEIEPERKSVKN